MPEHNSSLARQNEQPTLSVAQVRDMTGFDVGHIALIRHNMATSLGTDPEQVPWYDVAVFAHAASALGLDPTLRQIYWLKRGGKPILQVGIDGYRSIADRSGAYAGSPPAVFRGRLEYSWQDGPKDNVMTVPELAEVTVWKIVQGRPCAFVGTARWLEFAPTAWRESFQWRRMPYHMLAKVAEAQALRKGFAALKFVELDTTADTFADTDEASSDPLAAARMVVDQVAATAPPPPAPAPRRASYDDVYHEELASDRGQPTLVTKPTVGQVDTRSGEVFEREELPDFGPELEPEPEPQPDPAGAPDPLAYNRHLMAAARDLQIRAIGHLAAEASWPESRIVQANVALEVKIGERQRQGDQAVGASQDRILA